MKCTRKISREAITCSRSVIASGCSWGAVGCSGLLACILLCVSSRSLGCVSLLLNRVCLGLISGIRSRICGNWSRVSLLLISASWLLICRLLSLLIASSSRCLHCLMNLSTLIIRQFNCYTSNVKIRYPFGEENLIRLWRFDRLLKKKFSFCIDHSLWWSRSFSWLSGSWCSIVACIFVDLSICLLHAWGFAYGAEKSM